ncbi:hypothetical protein CRG98_020839 [Punica granatum]|uniref:Uncharacterized protein n=1 Tax=Punica granatum TaxID=22663 RepID=A0A2I0JSC1_PUNGR|nr:hypothetical protein CRG98_020839 [Punica granatum]
MFEEIVPRLDALGIRANQNEEDRGRAPRVVPLEPPIARCASRRIQIYEEEFDEEEIDLYDQFARLDRFFEYTEVPKEKLSAPYFGLPAPTGNTNGYLGHDPTSMTEESPAKSGLPLTIGSARATTRIGHTLQKISKGHQKRSWQGAKGNRRKQTSSKHWDDRSRHDSTIHSRITRMSEGFPSTVQAESRAQSLFGEILMSELYTTHSQQTQGLGKSFHLGPCKSYRSPERCSNGLKRFPTNLRGSFSKNEDSSSLRTHQHTQKTLGKLRLQILEPSPVLDLQSRPISQLFCLQYKARQCEQYSTQSNEKAT